MTSPINPLSQLRNTRLGISRCAHIFISKPQNLKKKNNYIPKKLKFTEKFSFVFFADPKLLVAAAHRKGNYERTLLIFYISNDFIYKYVIIFLLIIATCLY